MIKTKKDSNLIMKKYSKPFFEATSR